MRLVIDAYNVIFAETWPEKKRTVPRTAQRGRSPFSPRELEQMREDLLRRLEEYRLNEGDDVTVVFDGGEEGAHLARFQHFGGLEVIFSDPRSSADEEIVTYLRESSHARDMRVVTDDRPLALSAKHLGARVAGTAWLVEHMDHSRARRGDAIAAAEPAGKYEGPAESEIDGWTETFGDLDESDFEDDDS